MSLTSRRLCTSIVVIGSLFAALIMPNTPAVADSNEAITGFQAPASKITAGDNHTCAVENDGDVYCWGQNNHGQFGNGTTISTSTPSKVLFPDAAAPVTAITGSAYHTCAVLTDGTVYCWGYNGNGQLGNGTTTANATPALATLPSAAATITAGNSHTCAVLVDGDVYCWGHNQYGQLGNDTNTDTYSPNPTPVRVTLPSAAAAITAGDSHTCAVLVDGDVYCWGYNYYGQLGNATNNGSIDFNPNPAPALVTQLSAVIAVTAGGYHTCAMLTNGTVYCWGSNQYGQLAHATGNGTNFPNPAPALVTQLSAVIAVTAGGYHTCAVLVDGDVYCWGHNRYGQLGNDTTNGTDGPNPAPSLVMQLSAAAAVTGGYDHTCAVLTGGDVYCWGTNQHGQLGNDTNSGTTDPNPIPLAAAIAGIAPTPAPTPTPTPTPTSTPVSHVPSGSTNSYATANLEELEAGPNEIRVHGWSFDPDLPTKDLVVHVYAFFDGVGDPVALDTPVVRAADFRPDVNKAFGIGGDHGFNRTLAIRTGNHRVCVYSLSVDGTGALDGLNQLIGCRYVTVTDEAPPRGAFDVATQTGTSLKVSGWAYDLDRENDSLDIQVYLDGAYHTTIKADGVRTDVNQIVQISGNHGFNSTFTVPAGGHTVCLYAIGVDPTGAADGENVLLNVIDRPDCRTT